MSQIKIIGKENCGYCKRAKDLLEKTGLEYSYIDIGEVDMEDIPVGAKSFPIVFVNEEWIGGFDQLSIHEIVINAIEYLS